MQTGESEESLDETGLTRREGGLIDRQHGE